MGLLNTAEMKPTPRNPLLGLLADALTAGRDFADLAKVPAAVPLLGGQGLGSLLLGKAPEELTDISYGNMPVRINPLAGRTASFVPEIKPGRKEQVADLAMALQAVPGGNRAALAALGAVDTGVGKAAIAWHGSPHKFDRFDSSKIGTGEGAQAYGHGLYLAESPDVATSYKNLVQRDPNRLMVDGKVVSPDTMYGRAAEDVARIGVKATLQKIDDNIRFNEKYAPDMAAMYRDLRTKIEALEPTRVSLKEGNLYKVDLPDEKIARMLDWDKPLSQQAPEVQAAVFGDIDTAISQTQKALSGASERRASVTAAELEKLQRERARIANLSGGDYYRQQSLGVTSGQPNAADALRQSGIPGIRYLDQGSRSNFRVQNTYNGKPYGEPVSFMTEAQAKDYAAEQAAKGFGTNILPGTSNFVVFPGEEAALTILERNGGLLAP